MTSHLLALRRLLPGFDGEGLRNADPSAGCRRKPESRMDAVFEGGRQSVACES